MTTCLGKSFSFSVDCAWIAWAFVNLGVCFFPFWFGVRDVGFDCISFWSLPFFLQ